jgi:LmbE family N-acetylglucosaminyl deacetylase
MGLLRREEALAAARTLDLAPGDLSFLGYPDQGTLPIWYAHWAGEPAYRSGLTKAAAVPYANAFRPGAPYKGEEILRDLSQILREFRPTKIFVSHPGDYHPDHRALPLFLRVALWDLGTKPPPKVYAYLVHFKGWPKPRGNRPDLPLRPPPLLRDAFPWSILRLERDMIDRKLAALRAHRTQYGYSAHYLLSFVRRNELFGEFPSLRLRSFAEPLSARSAGERLREEAPEGLTAEEEEAFVGFEDRSIRLEDGRLVLSVAYSRPLAEDAAISIFAFGYRADTPFGRMPKLHVKFGAVRHRVFDRMKELPARAVEVTRRPREIVLKIPLVLLGKPEKILTSAHSYMGSVPLDWVAWRILALDAPPARESDE